MTMDADSPPEPGMEVDSPPEPGDDSEETISRRTLIRILVGLGIGIPVVVEGLTLLGLVGDQFGGDGSDGTDTATAADNGVGVGDELLPGTAPTETVVEGYVTGDDWTFTLVVTVDNGSDRTYELRLGAVTTEDGDRVDGGRGTGSIEPGESASVTGQWSLPEGSTPESVDVVAVAGDATEVERQVRLGKFPVRG